MARWLGPVASAARVSCTSQNGKQKRARGVKRNQMHRCRALDHLSSNEPLIQVFWRAPMEAKERRLRVCLDTGVPGVLCVSCDSLCSIKMSKNSTLCYGCLVQPPFQNSYGPARMHLQILSPFRHKCAPEAYCR
eukprot:6462868-Amphidinium_carterae.3